MNDRVCQFCLHWLYFKNDRATPATVGSCNLGGPRPEDGNSDCRGSETCEKWQEKKS